MLDPKRLCAGRITVVSIINPGLKSTLDAVSRDGWKNRTSGCSAAIYSNQYRNLFIRQASLAGLAAPAACLSVKIAIPFTAFQNIGFVSLDNAFELRVGAAPVRPTLVGTCGAKMKVYPIVNVHYFFRARAESRQFCGGISLQIGCVTGLQALPIGPDMDVYMAGDYCFDFDL